MEEHDHKKHHLYHLLKICIHENDVKSGRKVYSQVVKSGLESDSFLGCHLIRMFTVFEDLGKANDVFHKILEPNIYVWGAILMANINLGNSNHAVELYFNIRKTGMEPDGHVYVAALQACASLPSLIQAMEVHDHIIESGLECNMYVGNALIDMYSKCGSLANACRIFYSRYHLDLVTWSTMISGYAQHDRGVEALDLLEQMLKIGMNPDGVTLVSCLKACSDTRNFEYGKVIHGNIVRYCDHIVDV